MRPVQAYGGDDYRSIEADNTSSFNCRAATGSSNWSNHAYGYAIDLNPLENPYIENGRVFHTALGHAGGGKRTAQQCVGFIVTFQRGAEWAATGKVTQKIPADFPAADKVSLRE